MEAIVNLRRSGFFAPFLQPVVQAATNGLDDEIYVGGRAAEGRRFVAAVEIVVAVRVAKLRQVKVRMHVNAAGDQVLATTVDDLVAFGGKILADQGDFFAFHQHVGLHHVAGSDDRAIFEECAHTRLQLKIES
jgi:hypothetical protein